MPTVASRRKAAVEAVTLRRTIEAIELPCSTTQIRAFERLVLRFEDALTRACKTKASIAQSVAWARKAPERCHARYHRKEEEYRKAQAAASVKNKAEAFDLLRDQNFLPVGVRPAKTELEQLRRDHHLAVRMSAAGTLSAGGLQALKKLERSMKKDGISPLDELDATASFSAPVTPEEILLEGAPSEEILEQRRRLWEILRSEKIWIGTSTPHFDDDFVRIADQDLSDHARVVLKDVKSAAKVLKRNNPKELIDHLLRHLDAEEALRKAAVLAEMRALQKKFPRPSARPKRKPLRAIKPDPAHPPADVRDDGRIWPGSYRPAPDAEYDPLV